MYLSTLANNRRLTSCFIHGRTPVRRAAILRRGSTRCITKRRKNARLSSPGGVVVIVVVVVMVVAGAESETRALIALAKITQPCCGYGKEGAGGGRGGRFGFATETEVLHDALARTRTRISIRVEKREIIIVTNESCTLLQIYFQKIGPRSVTVY